MSVAAPATRGPFRRHPIITTAAIVVITFFAVIGLVYFAFLVFFAIGMSNLGSNK